MFTGYRGNGETGAEVRECIPSSEEVNDAPEEEELQTRAQQQEDGLPFLIWE